jgi:hypothetical protein
MQRNTGGSALARELGADPGNICRMMQRGMTPDQIRAKYEARAQLKKRGVGVEGKPTSQAPPRAGSPGEPPREEDIPVPYYFHKSDPVSIAKQANTLAEIKLRKETALTIATELSNAQRAGDLLPKNWVESWCGEAIIKAREMILKIPTELRDRLATESDPFVIEALLRTELQRALETLERMQWPDKATG